MGLVLGFVVLFSPAPDNIRLGVLGLASSLITGALGYIGGHASASSGTTETNATTVNPIPAGIDPPLTKK
jgi:hypothetical protein